MSDIRWLAPESVRHLKFSSRSDVFAYGALMYEVASMGDDPFPALAPQDLLQVASTLMWTTHHYLLVVWQRICTGTFNTAELS